MVVLPLPDRDASGPGKPLNGPGACRERADRGTINLAGPAQRDLVDDEDSARCGVAVDLLRDAGAQRLWVRSAPRFGDDEGHDLLAEPFIGNTHNSALSDGRIGGQDVLDDTRHDG